MKTFSLFTYKCSEEKKRVWEDMGFKIIGGKDLGSERQNLDVFFWCWSKQDNEVWKSIKKMLPKVLVITGRRGIAWPKDLSGLYEPQMIIGNKLSFTLGSKIEGKVKVPDWQTYVINGLLTDVGEVKALAGSVYRFLLEDVMRENEEWCGHMSSVVGPA
ncbi:MAG: hypothetical protein FH756_04245 [Firmicutes bacterium]|nr:hypothetical protein [Bacillota bacterium]